MRIAAKWTLILELVALGACDHKPTNTARCGTPLEEWQEPQGLTPVANLVRLHKTDALTWNGQSVTDDTLANYLRQASAMNPPPAVVLAMQDGTACSRARQIRSLMHAAPICAASRRCTEDSNWNDPGGLYIQ